MRLLLAILLFAGFSTRALAQCLCLYEVQEKKGCCHQELPTNPPCHQSQSESNAPTSHDQDCANTCAKLFSTAQQLVVSEFSLGKFQVVDQEVASLDLAEFKTQINFVQTHAALSSLYQFHFKDYIGQSLSPRAPPFC